jgi:type III restriction enzyme
MEAIKMSSEKFLYEKLFEEFGKRTILDVQIDKEILENLNPNFPLREYQKEAFQMFKTYFENQFDFKVIPNAVLFNMATGSGKTLIMAGLINYLYKKGYRNFLFFVNSNNIIEKTKDNFLNQNSIKYLFNKKIVIDGNIINIKEVNNFEGVSKDDINICFTTIQKLHSDLHQEKENALTFDNFKNKKIVLIADEAHHGQVKTKQKTLDEKPNWENTIEKILENDKESLLLEFTATMGFENDKAVYSKYLNRLLYRYDLREFVKNGFSKDIEIFKVDGDKKYRILTAVLINQFRQDIASKHGLKNFKPVMLIKAQKEIKDSLENHKLFRELIDNLSKKDIEEIKSKSNNKIITKLFSFYNSENISTENLIKKIQISFAEKNCLNVNEENLDKKSISLKDKEELISQQNILNTLESKENPIRAIFAVHKLNEGWDVLNLFDIVRVDSKQSGGGGYKGKVSPATISEAQLIGRGARYFPFAQDNTQEVFKRKFDEELNHDLRIIEELYFHSFNESRYIAELKKALVEKGLIDDKTEEKELKLKESFKKTSFYKTGTIYLNEKKEKDYSKTKSFNELGFHDKDFTFQVLSGISEKTDAMTDENYDNSKIKKTTKTIKLSEIEPHIIKNAIAKIDFFNLNRMKKIIPKLESINDLLVESQFLNGINIKFEGTQSSLDNINNKDLFSAVYSLLNKIKDVIEKNIIEYIGTKEFKQNKISEIFKDKPIKLEINSEKYDGDENYLSDKNWYAFESNFGTSEEKACVKFIERLINENLKEKFKEVYLLRNELHFKLYNFSDGQGFAPDFVLFMKNKNGKELTYQIFIEPKGKHIEQKDKWKEEFLIKIKDEFNSNDLVKFIETTKYKVVGLPFYNQLDENKFGENLLNFLN